MTTATFDTLQFVKTLKDADFSDKQAEAISSAFQDAQRESDLATKADTRILETKIDALASDISSQRWMLGIIVVLTVIPLVRDLI
uniref:DUF1640 domain-containing protein n=1 Tax=Candidatus Kentrum sp. FW TaxID=2126338 RepID=A0A450TSF8_9GAMM|nr:MAG: hypothetical protein BECKFW1821C_GA0114237_102633 [Candidatus Kentron sp. FW]